MAEQLDFFVAPSKLPEGFRYQRDVISSDLEQTLLEHFRVLPFKDFEFHGYTGKRRTVSFGWSYDFEAARLRPAEPIPEFLQPLRDAAAAFAGSDAGALGQVLVSEYGPGAGIGWHRDKGVFGDVIGISLATACQFRLRRRVESGWERVTIEAEPRSAYLLQGPVRTEWEHSIPAVDALRYSVTFRTLR